ncbi:MAG: Arginase, catabolizes arginine to ornithine and urea [Cyphobasidiales sp. Tagirdzhanova-0007]|nr:MAG: Arginase, catabolizes arginine to ornithine and urea [Cyphobasidiales sp. Tagirdzhanova-0007]
MGHVPPYGGGEYPQYPGQASSSQMFMTPPPSQPSPYSSGYQQQPYYGSGGGNAAQPLPSFGVPAGYQQQGGYLPPPPGPPQQPYNLGIDPNVFRGYYLYELQQLTFNSKPIINGLTVLAQEHSHRMGPIVAQCLDEHIRQAPPPIKLPALYLLDSICKNVGPPYTALLARSIDRIFLSAYHEVDQSTKVKLEELLGTWRNGAPDGGELFQLQPGAPLGAIPPQRAMEEALFGRRPSPPIPSSRNDAQLMPPMPPIAAMPLQAQNPYHHQQSPQPPQPGLANTSERAAVLYDLRKLLGIRREQAAANPADKSNFDQIATIQQLENLVLHTSLGSTQILQIREQLARLTPSQQSRIETPPLITKIEAAEDNYAMRGKKRQRLISPPPPARSSPPPASSLPNASLSSLTSLLKPNILRAASAQAMRASATPPPPPQLHPPIVAPIPTTPVPNPDYPNSLANLDIGLLSSLALAAKADKDAATTVQNKAHNDAALNVYEQHRMHYYVRLQNNDIARCKQCGSRYLDCPLGKDRLDKDLDRHLRISRRYTEGTGAQRVVGRSWFVEEEEWVLPANAIQPSEAIVKTEEAKKAAAATAELLNSTVPVPADAATEEDIRRCPICKEEFKNEYSEEDEDWGVDEGPLRIIEAGLLNDIKKLGWEVDFDEHHKFQPLKEEDDPPFHRMKRPRLVSNVNKEVSEAVYSAASKGRLVLTLGGDHSLALATVSGTFKQYPEACLIWIDAHPDINTPETTESGNAHGCPVSFLLGLPGTDFPEFGWVKPVLKPDRLVYVGLRDADEPEKKLIRENNIKAFSMFHIDKYGIGKVIEMALDAVNPNRDRPIHLSFDIDACDPSVAPSTGTPVRGGLTFREAHYIVEAMAETNLLVSLDIMEVNPAISADKEAVDATINMGRSLVRAALGESLL